MAILFGEFVTPLVGNSDRTERLRVQYTKYRAVNDSAVHKNSTMAILISDVTNIGMPLHYEGESKSLQILRFFFLTMKVPSLAILLPQPA